MKIQDFLIALAMAVFAGIVPAIVRGDWGYGLAWAVGSFVVWLPLVPLMRKRAEAAKKRQTA